MKFFYPSVFQQGFLPKILLRISTSLPHRWNAFTGHHRPEQYRDLPQHCILPPDCSGPLPAVAGQRAGCLFSIGLNYSPTVIWLLTPFTPCMSLTSFSTSSFSAAFLVLPPTVTTP